MISERGPRGHVRRRHGAAVAYPRDEAEEHTTLIYRSSSTPSKIRVRCWLWTVTLRGHGEDSNQGLIRGLNTIAITCFATGGGGKLGHRARGKMQDRRTLSISNFRVFTLAGILPVAGGIG